MEITEVRVKLMEDPGERLLAFCSITIDHCFVVRDLKIIEGLNGPFVAMPSRKLTSHCPSCNSKNHFRARYCNDCGRPQPSEEPPVDRDGRAKLYADIAHPINTECRERLQQRVIEAYQLELKLSQEPGYVSRYDDLYEHDVVPPPHAVRRREEQTVRGGQEATRSIGQEAFRNTLPENVKTPPRANRSTESTRSSAPMPSLQSAKPSELERPPAQRTAEPKSSPDFGAGIFE